MPDGNGTAAGADAGFDLSKIADDAVTTVKINERDVTLKVKDLPKLAAMGYRFSERMEEVQKKEAEVERERAAYKQRVDQEYEPQTRLMRYLEEHPEKRTMIRMIVNDEGRVVPLNGHGGEGDDAPGGTSTIDLARLRDEVKGELGSVARQLQEKLDSLSANLGTISQKNQDQESIDYLRSNPTTKDLVTDASITDAKEYRRKHGGDLISAFRNVTYDDAQALARSKVVQEYGIDTESLELPGSRPPVVGGLTLDDKTLDRLFGPDADPDELAKHAKAIRQHRKELGGKKTAVRARR